MAVKMIETEEEIKAFKVEVMDKLYARWCFPISKFCDSLPIEEDLDGISYLTLTDRTVFYIVFSKYVWSYMLSHTSYKCNLLEI